MEFQVIHLVIAAVIAFVAAAIIFFPLGISYRKKVSEKEISSAEEEARRRGAKGEILVTSHDSSQSARVGQEAVNSHDLILTESVTATASGSAGF